MLRQVLLLGVVLGFGFSAAAQVQEAQPVRGQRGPSLVARDETGKNPIQLARVEADVLIDGALSQTTLTLTFSSSANRVMEGELVFPLPQGVTVSGYGLDINGEIVDGVAVEKQQARVSYEKEIRQRIDPGLLEQVAGNNFRTRVYPIPPGGTRTVKIRFEGRLSSVEEGLKYLLPMNWDQRADCVLKIQAPGLEMPPVVANAPLGELKFQRRDNAWVALAEAKYVRLLNDLSLTVTRPGNPVSVRKQINDAIEKPEADRRASDTSDYFFAINDAAPPVPQRVAATAPKRLGIFWDASMSRRDADTGREIALVRRLLAENAGADVDVVVFRDIVEPPVTFAAGNGEGVTRFLSSLVYDGGTNLGSVVIPRNLRQLSGAPPQGGAASDYDFCVLFTDGLGDLGLASPAKPPVPLYVVSNDDRSNHALLAQLALRSNGAYLNLRQLSDDQAVAAVGKSVYSLVAVDFKPSEIADVTPSAGPVLDGVSVCGKLLAAEAKITLRFGFGGKATDSRTYTLRRDAATEGDLVGLAWAQQRVAELSAEPAENYKQLLALGRQFNLATPATSLLVLETAEQYARNHVAPPKNRSEVYKQYLMLAAGYREQEQKTHEERVQQVLAMWMERVQWWTKSYDYPKGFKYAASREEGADGPRGTVTGGGRGSRGGGAGGERASDLAATTSPRGADVGARRPSQEPAVAAAHPQRNQSGAADALMRPAAPEFMPNAIQPGQFQPALRDMERGPAPSARSKAGDVQLEAAEALASQAHIQMRDWDPNTPYLAALKAAQPARAYAVFIEQRKTFGTSPAFYLDCADFFLNSNQPMLGVRILTDVAELQLEDARLLRIVAHRLNQIGRRDMAIDLFEKILQMRPEEPQSHRDLALALSDGADQTLANHGDINVAISDYTHALSLLNDVALGSWDRFQGI